MDFPLSELGQRSFARRTIIFLGDKNWESIFNPLFEEVFFHLDMGADVCGFGSGSVGVYLPIGEKPFGSFVRFLSIHRDEYSQAIVLLPKMSEIEIESLHDFGALSNATVPLKVFTIFSDGSFEEVVLIIPYSKRE